MKTEPLDRTRQAGATRSLQRSGTRGQEQLGASDGISDPKHRRLGLKLPVRRTGILVGALFLVQMVTFSIGNSLIETFVDGGAGRTTLTIGVLLEMCSGIAVVGIGLLMYPILRLVNDRLAFWYPAFRILELAVSAACGIYLLAQLKLVPNYSLLIYLPTAIGGLVLTYLLFVSRLVPRAIAGLGLAGYALLLLAVPLDLLTSLDVNRGAGLILLAPGGLFEFVALPIWLFAKGFDLRALQPLD
jgi:hypothetical protein